MIRTQQRTCIRATVCWAVALACLVISARADDRPAARAAGELHAGKYDVRARAARLLGYLGGAEHGPALADMVMRDRARQPREAAAVALAQIGAESYGTFVVARLAGELGTPDPDLRMELAKPFILPCATLSSPEYLALMARLTADKDPRLRRECLKCLPLMPAGSGLQFGIAALDDPDQDHHALALQALIWCVDADTAAALAGRMMTEQPSEGNALGMLRAMAAPAGLEQPSATAGLRHPAPAVRALAAALASRVPGTRSQLVSACHDAAPGVRREAIAGLGRIDPGAAARIAMGNPARDALIRKHSWAADSPAADELVLGTFMADEGHGVWRAAECVARQRDGMTVLTRLARSADAAEANAAVRMLAAEGTLDASRALAACIWTEQGGLAASAPPVVELALRGLLVADEPLRTAPMPGSAQGLNEDALCRLIDALGAMGTQEAAARLRGLRANWMTTEGRLKRVRALAPVEGTEAQQALLEALNDHDARVRQLAADALMWRGGEDRSVLLRYAEGLEGNVRDSVLCSAVRHAAVSGLLRPDRCGVEELRAVASQVRGDTDDPYLLALCAAAGLDGAEYMLRHALLGAGTDAKARVELCRAVGNIGGGPGYTALGELLSMLADDAPAAAWHSGSKRIPLLLAAIEAMGLCGDPKAVFLLEPFLADAPTIRAAALRALARLMPERWSALCERALFDGDDGVRSLASGLAAGLSDRGARALLREFSNAETGQKAVLIASLGRCFCPAARDALRRIAASGDAPEAARAAWALAGARASEDNLDAALLLVDSGLLWVRDGCRDEDRRSLLAEGNSCRAKVMLAAGHPQAVRWARLAYLDEPRPETLNLIADCIALNGHGERAGHLRRVAAWQKYELAANDSR
ncbi:MAG: hypothetical protein HPY44_05440 [Armatimonadetes bacterium]|nr:hypothetical protein [Armatimonadota bacterium]